jgi:precorrin-8X/cobalt-precorrin-8 methylmutase
MKPPAPGSISVVGRRIMDESFAIIERELGPQTLPSWAFAVVRRMIHASADFEFAQTLRYSADFPAAVEAGLRGRAPVITDTEMMLMSIRSTLDPGPSLSLTCHLNDPETQSMAAALGMTRSAAGIHVASRYYAAPLLVIGNATTAVEEALRLAEQGWRPAALIAMPVGFVGVEEAKRCLVGQTSVPFLTCMGRKGGSAVTAAAFTSLVELVRSQSRCE